MKGVWLPSHFVNCSVPWKLWNNKQGLSALNHCKERVSDSHYLSAWAGRGRTLRKCPLPSAAPDSATPIPAPHLSHIHHPVEVGRAVLPGVGSQQAFIGASAICSYTRL